MQIYYIIYFVLFILSLSDHLQNKRIKQYILLFLTLFFILFVGLRYQVGNDYGSYYDNYLKINSGQEASASEPMYVLANRVFSFEFVIFFFSLFSFIFMRKGISYFGSDFPLTALLVYYSLFLITFNIHILRQGLSIALILCSYKYLYEKKYFITVLYIIVATLFHTSAIIMLPFIFVFNRNIKLKVQILLFVGSLLVFINAKSMISLFYGIAGAIPLLNLYLAVYRVDEMQIYAFSLGMLMDIVLLIFFMTKYHQLLPKEQFIYRIFFTSVILSLLLAINPAALRLNYYFRVMIIFMFPLMYKYMRIKIIPMIAIFVIMVLYLYTTFNGIGEYGRGDRNLKYKTILEKREW